MAPKWPFAAVGLLVLALSCASGMTATPQDMGLSFNETLAGFYYPGDIDYQTAFDKGRAANLSLSFVCHVVIPHMRAFTNDSQHIAQITGSIQVANLTKPQGASVQGGRLSLFNGSVVDHELRMYYYLPFTGADGKPYHLEGVKHLAGDNCTHIFYMATTLYVHVRTGTAEGQGTILSTGMVQIDFREVLDLIASFRLIGNGTDADKLDVIAEFAEFLVQDIEEDCFNVSNWETQFWYIWASDSNAGFLLDLVARPNTLEIRLASYTASQSPVVTKQYLPLEQLVIGPTSVAFGSTISMSSTACDGSDMGIAIDAEYSLNIGSNDFIPPVLWAALHGLLPQIHSDYGRLQSGKVAGHTYAPSTPLVRTSYTFEYFLHQIQWVMISAMNFTDSQGNPSDLRLEMVALDVEKDNFLGSSFMTLAGRTYHLNDPATARSQVTANGTISSGVRKFGVHVTQGKDLDVLFACSAPVGQFALLEDEGSTRIRSTVMGSCSAVDNHTGVQYASFGQVLLEVKNLEP